MCEQFEGVKSMGGECAKSDFDPMIPPVAAHHCVSTSRWFYCKNNDLAASYLLAEHYQHRLPNIFHSKYFSFLMYIQVLSGICPCEINQISANSNQDLMEIPEHPRSWQSLDITSTSNLSMISQYQNNIS